MTDKKQNQKTNYGNWVPANLMYMAAAVLAVLALLEALNLLVWKHPLVCAAAGILFVLVLAFALYMGKCRRTFAFDGGGLMGEIHEFLVNHLLWNGKGTLLDIGCGAGALTIRCAKRFPKARLTGMDYWGKEWNYAKEQCEENARAEGVAGRTVFEQGDAASLNYSSESFDAAVSNFVFHEVRTQPDKRLVVREALRVVKKGGAFAFQDMFAHRELYGDMAEFVEQLKAEEITEIHYIPEVDKLDFIPGFIRAPWMLRGMGLLYGIK